MAFKGVHAPFPGTCDYVMLLGEGGNKVANGIKVANQLALT